jgi:ABC-type nitrate/sulfonate/bicarbonate transport system substrate-binding protein
VRIVVVGLLAMLFAGCQPSLPAPSIAPTATGAGPSPPRSPSPPPGSGSPSALPVERSTLRIGLAFDPGFGLVALDRAIDDLADAADVSVELSTLDGPNAAIRAVTTAEVDLAILPLLPAVNAVSGGIGIRVIMADAVTTDELLVARPGLAAAGELAGSTVATDPPGSYGRAVAALCLERSGLSPAAVQFVDVGGPVSRQTAVLTDHVVATTIPAVLALEAVREGRLAVLASCGRAVGPLLQTGVVAADEFLLEHPVLVQRFVDAYIDAQRWAEDDRMGYLARSRSVAPTLGDDLRGDLYDEFRSAGRFAVDGGLTAERIDRLEAFAMAAALLQLPVAEDWSTLSYVMSYLDRHGPG